MSWETVNEILGLAAIDKKFAQELLEKPIEAINARGFRLTAEEEKAFSTASARNLRELSQSLRQNLPPDRPNSN